MNMKKYYHLLTLRKSEPRFILNTRWVHDQTTPVELRRPPPPLSYYARVSQNTYNRNTIVSHNYSHSSLALNHYRFYSQLSTIQTSELRYHVDEGPLDYQVVVKGRDVISATAMQGYRHWLPLSNLDLLLPAVEAGVFFCYKKKTNMSPDVMVNTIKTSLAGVLSTFYPLAGEIVPNNQGEPEVLCNNNGVEFVHAHADVDLKDLDFHHPDASVNGKLVPKINRGVLSIQATELNCGAMIISCAVDHRVADGQSLSKFLTAWAEYAQFETISDIPSFRPSILNPRRPPRHNASLDNIYIPISMLPPPSSFEEPLHSRIYYIDAPSINRIQSEASSKGTNRTKILSFTAYLWKLLAFGGDDSANRTSRMGIVVDGRRFLTGNNDEKSSSSEKHFGNVLSVPYGVATNGDLKAMPLNEVANGVHNFVADTTNEEHFRGLIDWVELHRPQTTVARIYFGLEKSKGDAVVVSSGRGLPIEYMDFGWGKPEFGSFHFPWGSRTGYVVTMPSAKANGDWVVYVHLKQKDLDVIDSMAPHVFAPLTHSHFR